MKIPSAFMHQMQRSLLCTIPVRDINVFILDPLFDIGRFDISQLLRFLYVSSSKLFFFIFCACSKDPLLNSFI